MQLIASNFLWKFEPDWPISSFTTGKYIHFFGDKPVPKCKVYTLLHIIILKWWHSMESILCICEAFYVLFNVPKKYYHALNICTKNSSHQKH